MVKRLGVLVLLGVFVSGIAIAAPAALRGVSAKDLAQYSKLQGSIDFLFAVAIDSGVAIQDVRVSPLVRSDSFEEFPIEIGLSCREAALPKFLESFKMFALRGGLLDACQVTISRTANQDPKVDDVVTVNISLKAVFPDVPGSIQRSTSTIALATALRRLGKHASFGIGALGPGQAGLEQRIHITNLRIDSDCRVQLTGFGLHPTDVTKFGKNLLNTGSFVEPFVMSMNHSTVNGVGCWRFDVVARVYNR